MSVAAAVDLSRYGWDPEWAALADPLCTPTSRPGRISRADRGRVSVITAAGVVLADVAPNFPDSVTTGDWVLCEESVDRISVVTLLPRRSALVRGAGRKDTRAQLLAANVDVVFVVAALSAAPNLARIERLVALAWESGAQPVVVLTKADLCRTVDTERSEVAATAPGVAVHAVSAVDGRGLAEMAAYAANGRTAALVGSSGVGKSSLINALAGADILPTAAIRADGRGRHTTTARELVAIPNGGVLLDTPGLRSVALWDSEDGLARVFPEVDLLARSCRFRDCGHDGEPGCAVAAAVADGSLPAARVQRWRKLTREQEWAAAKQDERLRMERARQARVRYRGLARATRGRPGSRRS